MQITNEPKILKQHQISKETQITDNPQILKHQQISQENPNYK